MRLPLTLAPHAPPLPGARCVVLAPRGLLCLLAQGEVLNCKLRCGCHGSHMCPRAMQAAAPASAQPVHPGGPGAAFGRGGGAGRAAGPHGAAGGAGHPAAVAQVWAYGARSEVPRNGARRPRDALLPWQLLSRVALREQVGSASSPGPPGRQGPPLRTHCPPAFALRSPRPARSYRSSLSLSLVRAATYWTLSFCAQVRAVVRGAQGRAVRGPPAARRLRVAHRRRVHAAVCQAGGGRAERAGLPGRAGGAVQRHQQHAERLPGARRSMVPGAVFPGCRRRHRQHAVPESRLRG